MKINHLLIIFGLLFGLTGCISKPHQPPKFSVLTQQQSDLLDEYFYQAEAAKQRNQSVDAYKLYEKALQIDPSKSDIWYQLARISVEGNQWLRGFEQARNARILEPKNYWIQHLYAQTAAQTQKPAVVDEAYQTLIALKPTEAINYFDAANYFAQRGLPKNAIEYLNQLEKIIGIETELSELKMELFQSMRKQDLALKEALKLYTYDPNKLENAILLVRAYFQNNQRSEAEKILQKLDSSKFQVQMFWAEIYRKDGKKTEQYQALNTAFSDDEMPIEDQVAIMAQELMLHPAKQDQLQLKELIQKMVQKHPESAAIHSLNADVLFGLEEWKAARSAFAQAISKEKGKQKLIVWQQYLNCDVNLQDYDSLIVHAQKATEYFPLQPLYYFYQGIGYIQKKEFESAVSVFNKAMELTTDEKELRAEIYSNLGEAFNGLKNYTASDEAFEASLTLVPDNIGLMNNYAYYLTLRRQKLDRAEEMIQKVIQKEPNQPSYLDTYAWVLFCRGKYAEALPIQIKAVDLAGTSNATLLEHLGDIYSKLGNATKAMEFWEKTLKIGSDDAPHLQRKLKAGTYVD